MLNITQIASKRKQRFFILLTVVSILIIVLQLFGSQTMNGFAAPRKLWSIEANASLKLNGSSSSGNTSFSTSTTLLVTSTTTSTTNSTSTRTLTSTFTPGVSTTANLTGPVPSCTMRALTIVSGYINIGDFAKGPGRFTTEKYRTWLRPMAMIENPLVFFTDDPQVAKMVAAMRVNLGDCTHIRLVNRSELWGFSLLDKIRSVITQPGYPKFQPNTVVPEYAAIMHSKFAMLEIVINNNPFPYKTEFISWMDSGLFRERTFPDYYLALMPPPGMNKAYVAGNQVPSQQTLSRSPREIFRSEYIWLVGGGYFIAERNVMNLWCQEYRRFAEYFLAKGLSNSDQQIIYSMYTDEITQSKEVEQPKVRLQRYLPHEGTSWYHLRHLSVEEGVREKKRMRIMEETRQKQAAGQLKAKFTSVAELPWLDEDNSTKENFTIPHQNVSQCTGKVTLVIGFFSFGLIAFRKDDEMWQLRDSNLYSNWIGILAKCKNPVVAYFDSREILSKFVDSRRSQADCTHAFLIERESLWSWKLLPWLINISRTDQSFSTKFVIPEQLAAQHSRFPLLEKAMRLNPFGTPHFAWLDIPFLNHYSKLLNFTIQKANASESVEFARFEALNKSDQLCAQEIPISYLVGSMQAMQNLSKAYQLIAETSILIWQTALKTQEIVHAIYCWPNASAIVSGRLRDSLPKLEVL